MSGLISVVLRLAPIRSDWFAIRSTSCMYDRYVSFLASAAGDPEDEQNDDQDREADQADQAQQGGSPAGRSRVAAGPVTSAAFAPAAPPRSSSAPRRSRTRFRCYRAQTSRPTRKTLPPASACKGVHRRRLTRSAHGDSRRDPFRPVSSSSAGTGSCNRWAAVAPVRSGLPATRRTASTSR